MPEESEDFIHIPVSNKDDFKEKTFQTIILSATRGIKAVKGELKEDDGNTYIHKYLFDKSKDWTMSKAKKWIKRKKSEKDTFDIGLSTKRNVEVLMPMKPTTQTSNRGNRVIEGYATISSFNRNGYHITNDAFNETLEEFMENPVLLFMHWSELVIGSVLELKIDKQGVFVKAELLPEGKSGVADEAWNAIESGSLKAFSIGFLVLAYEKVCMEKDKCFFSITEGELVELSVVSVPAVRGSYFKIKDDTKNKKKNNFLLKTSISPEGEISPYIPILDNTLSWSGATNTTATEDYYWHIDTTGVGDNIEYDFELDDNMKVTQIIDDDEDKVKTMTKETPEPSTTEEEVEVDLSSTENKNDEIEARLLKVEEVAKAMAEKEVRLKEQSLNLQVKETMTLFKGVENKADIETHVTTVAKNGGEVALTAMKEILKSVMESKVVIDNKLTLSGGEEMKNEDKQSIEDFGVPMKDMVEKIVKNKPIFHEIAMTGGA